MKRRGIAVLAVFIFFIWSGNLFAHHGPEVIELNKIQKSMAPVTFQHYLHQDRVQDDCTVCHHTEEAGATKLKPCSDCHGKAEEAPGYKDAMHKKCKTCHKEKNTQGMKAPTKCTGCHVKK